MHATVPTTRPSGPSTLPSPSVSYTNTDPSQPQQVGFIPQLWQKRRTRTLEILRQHSHRIDWIADFGCNACALAHVLVNSCDFARLTCVDLDPQVLSAVHVAPLVMPPPDPSTAECASEAAPSEEQDDAEVDRWRERPMRIELMNGSIVDFDARVVGVDAIVLSEVIEHLDPEPLARLPRALFEFYRPKLVIVSTPNQTFNLHFPDPMRVRDPDHRFEWTEAQFTAWCDEQAARYGYTYTLSGVGLWPCCSRGQHEPRGYATQFATFLRAGMDPVAPMCKWPVQVLCKELRCDSGMDQEPRLDAAASSGQSSWTCVRAWDFLGYPGADLTSIAVDAKGQWTLSPAQDHVLRRVLDALLHHLCPAAVGIANASSYSCTLSQAWSQPAVRQAFRVPGNLVAFLQLPDLARRVGIQWARPRDPANVAPHRLHEVVWGKADAGRMERSEVDSGAELEVLIRARLEEERVRRERQDELDEWRDSGDDLSDWGKVDPPVAGECGQEDETSYDIAYSGQGHQPSASSWAQQTEWTNAAECDDWNVDHSN